MIPIAIGTTSGVSCIAVEDTASTPVTGTGVFCAPAQPAQPQQQACRRCGATEKKCDTGICDDCAETQFLPDDADAVCDTHCLLDVQAFGILAVGGVRKSLRDYSLEKSRIKIMVQGEVLNVPSVSAARHGAFMVAGSGSSDFTASHETLDPEPRPEEPPPPIELNWQARIAVDAANVARNLRYGIEDATGSI
jgi:hypothetical protein